MIDNRLEKLRFWCQKVLPTIYDDSLSYYELLNKVVEHLNTTVEAVEDAIDEINSFETSVNASIEEIQGVVDGALSDAVSAAESAATSASAAEEQAEDAATSAQAAQDALEYVEENLEQSIQVMGVEDGYLTLNNNVISVGLQADDRLAIVKMYGVPFVNIHATLKHAQYNQNTWYKLCDIDSSILNKMPSRFYGIGYGYVDRGQSVDDDLPRNFVIQVVAQYGDLQTGENAIRFRFIDYTFNEDNNAELTCPAIPITLYQKRS